MTSKTASEAAATAYAVSQIALNQAATYCSNPTAKDDVGKDYNDLADDAHAARKALEAVGVDGIANLPEPPPELVAALDKAAKQVSLVQTLTMIETTGSNLQRHLERLSSLAAIYGGKRFA